MKPLKRGGGLSSKDKVQLARLKLRGAARMFYSAQPQLRADDITRIFVLRL